MDPNDLQSIIGLNVQCAGIVLITILSFFMTRSIRRDFLNYWTGAWACLSVALISLSVAFQVSPWHNIYFAVYFLGEYAFGYLLIAGCRNYATGAKPRGRDLYLLIPASAAAIILSVFPEDFDAAFIPHAAFYAALFAMAYRALEPARRAKAQPGLRVMSLALVLLTLDFLHYVPVMAYVKINDITLTIDYLRFTSLYDLILEILLGFGTLMAVMDHARHQVEAANRELTAARDSLEVLARVDPLTSALNRHAFHSLIESRRNDPSANVSGCAVVVDIDNLKPINDSLGHAAGDAAIREVARSIRSVIRADDLLFRWGGDEFLVLLFNVYEAKASRRISRLNELLQSTRLPGSSEAVPLIVSYGLASFAVTAEIELAIERADSAMYAHKQARKAGERIPSGHGLHESFPHYS